MGTLAGVEMGLRAGGIPYRPGGVQAAIDALSRPSVESRKSEAVPVT